MVIKSVTQRVQSCGSMFTFYRASAVYRNDWRNRAGFSALALSCYKESQTVMYFRVVQVIKSLQDPLKVGNNLPGVNDNVRERGLEQKCF